MIKYISKLARFIVFSHVKELHDSSDSLSSKQIPGKQIAFNIQKHLELPQTPGLSGPQFIAGRGIGRQEP
jgi:hypothetical protein